MNATAPLSPSLASSPPATALVIGRPQFADAALAEQARSHGPAAAWQAAFAQHGARAPAAVTGEFAVGLTDAAGRTWLAVDRFAQRTLCWRIHGGRIQFAERADAWANEGAELDPQAIFDYLFFHAIPSPRTIFKGVYRLPPGHVACFENDKLTMSTYWIPEFSERLRGAPFGTLRDQFRGLLRDAVAARLDGGTPACFLSGGTDSSTVAGMIREAAGTPAHTYSIGFEAEGYDEMAFARIAAKHFGATHHEYYVTPDDLVGSIAAVARHYDQPFGNSSALPAFHCARVAREDGVTRLLAGDGGDELFGGNTRYVGSSRVDLQACKLEYSIVSPK